MKRLRMLVMAAGVAMAAPGWVSCGTPPAGAPPAETLDTRPLVMPPPARDPQPIAAPY